MYKLNLTSVMALLPILIMAKGIDPVHTTSTITTVTVFMHGAEIHAKAPVQMPTGNHDIVIEGVPLNIQSQTIQVSGTGDFTILSVQYHINYSKVKVEEKEIKLLQDSLEAIQTEIGRQENAKATLRGLAQVVESNKNAGGSTAAVNIEVYKQLLDIYFTKITKINEEMLLVSVKLHKLYDKEASLKKQLEPHPNIQPTGEIIVSVSSKSLTPTTLNISYVIDKAGWVPEYDIRCANITQPLSIVYKAQVYQACGLDWNNVKLTINTGNPTQSAYGQQLSPLYVGYYNPVANASNASAINTVAIKYINSMVAKSAGGVQRDNVTGINMSGGHAYNEAYIIDGMPVAGTLALPHSTYDFADIALSTTAIEYTIDQTYSIPSDSVLHAVEMQNKKIPVCYHYYAAPKLDMDAFLTAFITHWDTLNLISGNANIFFQGTYIGQSYISIDNTGDTLSLSLGRDKSIVIKRTLIKDYTHTRFLSNRVVKSFGYNISIRNTRAQSIDLQLFDQLPVSVNGNIEIKDTEYEGAKLEPMSGKLEWGIRLSGNEEKKVKLAYTIKYPKGRRINI